MRRRTFLATAGALFSAGCSEVIPPPRTTVRTREGTGTADRTVSDTVPTERPSETAPTPGETTDPQAGETTDPQAGETTTETDTPSQAEREAAEAIELARGHLQEALNTYVGFAEGEESTLLDVTSATSVGISTITNRVGRANNDLERVRQNASVDQFETAERLRGVGAFLAAGIRCQSPLRAAYDKTVFSVDRIYAESFGSLRSETSNIRARQEEAADDLQTLKAESAATDMQAFDGISEATYEQKVAQLDRAVTGYGTLGETLLPLGNALESFIIATNDFTDDNYDDAESPYREANDQLGSPADTLAALDPPDAVADRVTELGTATSTIADAIPDLVDAAEAGSGEREARLAAFDSAMAQLREEESLVREFESVDSLFVYYEENRD